MYSIVYATASVEEEARRIGRTVVEKRLAACANIFPIRAVYSWKGEVNEDDEHALILKTRSELVPKLIEVIQKESSDEVVCAVSYPISEGNREYLEWIEDSTRT